MKEMDPVLNALAHYRLTASPEQKAEDLARLEEECLSTVDANQYVCTVAVRSRRHAARQKGIVNSNLNPDYNLDFSFYILFYTIWQLQLHLGLNPIHSRK